jgi:hypothetical protein
MCNVWKKFRCPRDSYVLKLSGKRKVGKSKLRWPVKVNGNARKLGRECGGGKL